MPSAIQQSIARIQEACQAPPLSPLEYRVLFEVMAKEISENDLIGAQTLANITQRAQERGLELRRDDVRFVLEVVSEADPWFEQGASANLFAGRFRNFVVARCRGQGLQLSADELDLVDAWFAGGSLPQANAASNVSSPVPRKGGPTPPGGVQQQIGQMPPLPKSLPEPSPSGSRWWTRDDARARENERADPRERQRGLSALRAQPLAWLICVVEAPNAKKERPRGRSFCICRPSREDAGAGSLQIEGLPQSHRLP